MLSICLIVKNEENNITRCLNSISSIADEIIVVDTGSTDKTIEIAKSFNAKIYYHPWNNDFSEARNVAISKCTKDWIFTIDADEELSSEHAYLLKEKLNNSPHREAFYLRLENMIGTACININPSLRIFRNKPCYRYSGRLHEQIFFAIEENSNEDVFETTDFVLYHYGYDHNVINMDLKIRRNVEILEGTPECDRDGFFYFSLGSEYLKLNDHINAKKNFIQSLNTPSKDYGSRPYLSISLSNACLTLREYNTGLDYIRNHFQDLSDFKDLYFLEASICYELMKFSDSYSALMKFVNIENNPSKYPSFNFESVNDIDGLASALQTLSINMSGVSLASVVIIDSDASAIEEVIKNANEISSSVMIVSNIPLNEDLTNRIYECGATLLNCENEEKYDETISNILKQYSDSFVLTLYEDEILTHENRLQIANYVTNPNSTPIEFNIMTPVLC